MPRYKVYLDKNVVEAAKERLIHIFDTFDTVVFMFSGGKDSSVVINLAREVCIEQGEPDKKITVVFIDEEFIPDCVVEHVAGYRSKPWLDLKWLCLPMHDMINVCGTAKDSIIWDPNREHLRPMPDYAIRLAPGDNRLCMWPSQDPHPNSIPTDLLVDEILGVKGRTAHVVGVRADESLSRWRSVVNKLSENYICASGHGHMKIAKPVYDWHENDILKWLFEHGVPYGEAYEAQHLMQRNLRVSPLMHAEASRSFCDAAAMYPETYNRILAIFPEMAMQARYHNDIDRASRVPEYLKDGIEGCRRYVADYMDDSVKAQALAMLNTWETLNKNDPLAYPIRLILWQLVRGITYKMPTALEKKQQLTESRRVHGT